MTEHTEQTEQLEPPQGPFTLSDLARQRLDERIAAAGNNIDAVDAEIRAELEVLDSQTLPEEGPDRTRMQGERVHLQHQLGYLVKVRAAQEE